VFTYACQRIGQVRLLEPCVSPQGMYLGLKGLALLGGAAADSPCIRSVHIYSADDIAGIAGAVFAERLQNSTLNLDTEVLFESEGPNHAATTEQFA
jgi:hypothetical protein